MESLVALARICVARSYPADTWLRLLQEATPASPGTADEQERYHLAIDSLLPLVFADSSPAVEDGDSRNSSASHGLPPLSSTRGSTIKCYLDACCSSSQTAKSHLIKSMVDRTVANLDEDESHLRDLARTLDTLANLLFQNLSNPLPLVSLASDGEQSRIRCQRIVAVLRLLELSVTQEYASLFTLAAYLLHTNTPGIGDLIDCPETLIHEVVRARGELSSLPPNSVLPVEAVVSSVTSISTLENLINAAGGVGQQQMQGRDVLANLPSEINDIMAELIQQEQVVKRLSVSFLHFHKNALRQSNRNASESRKGNYTSWLRQLIAVSVRHILPSEHPKTRIEARWRAFAYGVLPPAIEEVALKTETGVSSDEWASFAGEVFEGFASAALLPKTSQKAVETLRKAWVVTAPSAGSMSDYLHQSPPAPEDLVAALVQAVYDYHAHPAAARLVVEQLSSWTASSDLLSLHSFYHRLVLETPRIVDYLFLHTSPGSVVSPLCCVLDSWGHSEDYGAGHAMELFGGLVLALQTLVVRHPHLLDSAADSPVGLCNALLTSPKTSSLAYPLAALPQDKRKLVASWISALFGNEGIDDDLIRSTHPYTLLSLASTIVEQSIMAQEAGIIDEETLLGGLSYFTQDLLNCTLPGIVKHCKTRKVVPSKVVESLTKPESTPRLILDLINSVSVNG